ncbi:MAG: asparagine synthase (glutamine-hydrolyzing) [Myxococcota bacterium]
MGLQRRAVYHPTPIGPPMCGIIGEISTAAPVDRARFDQRRDALAHRGPDGWGTRVVDSGRVAIGHRRLAVLDLSDAAAQPMSNLDDSVVLTFGGEIYNYRELRAELRAAGHRFASQCDAEVVLHGYEQWGPGVVSRLNGMFAFGVYDATRRTLMLARDRLGIKPLYYAQTPTSFVFGSELKAIISAPSVQRTLNVDAVADFLVHRFIPAPDTIWSGVHKLPPASLLLLKADRADRANKVAIRKYWHLTPDVRRPADAAEEAAQRLEQVVARQLVSDVPTGLLLSGGADSSALAHFMHARNITSSFSLGFEGWEKSEHRTARQVAQRVGMSHHERIVPSLLDLLPRASQAFDEPLGGSSFLPTMALSEFAAEHITVALGGDGGDEVFGGYRWYAQAVKSGVRTRDVAAFYFDAMSWADLRYADVRSLLSDSGAAQLSRHHDLWLYEPLVQHHLHPVRALQCLDLATFLPEVVLAKVDRASMAFGLEVRVPFLDHELVQWALGLDMRTLMPRGSAKALLRGIPGVSEALGRPKQGFGSPVHRWLRSANDWQQPLLTGPLVASGLIRQPVLRQWIAEGRVRPLWAVVILNQWARQWL